MKKISFGFMYPLLALGLLITVLSHNVFIVPPLGEFLNPFRGVVQNEKDLASNRELNFGRKEPIEIMFDERAVPHIFANNQNDLFFAQGYVTAADRLWQMDFISYFSAGRVSEILGANFINYDRHHRRMGVLAAAKNSLKLIEAEPETKRALDNYTKGVNKYIEQLSDIDLPLEYKMLDYRPEPWTNLKSVLIMKYMGALLSGYDEDVPSTYLLAALGKKEYDKLFSNYFINENKSKFSIDLIRDSFSTGSYIDYPFLESSPQVPGSSFNPRLGSNTWVVGPKKSKSGSAILCNDPHLNLTFPSVWYETQLASNEMNVHGYSIPGTPGIIIGYNQHISWGLTNGSTDVRDFFKLELKEDFSQYKFDGYWRNTIPIVEEIKVRKGNTLYDTVFYTIHGPITSDFRFGNKEQTGYAVNWTLYDPSNEFLAFIKLNKATNYEQFKSALKNYKCPVQNFSYADVEGNIATHLGGKVLAGDHSGSGKFILDGTKSEYLASKTLTYELPFVYNPKQAFVFSANNNPFHEKDSFYVNGHYSELRSGKINHLLAQSQKFTVNDMKLMQLDNTNRLAELALPTLLNFFPNDSNYFIKNLRSWDYKCEKNTKMAVVFEHWWSLIKNNTWDELKRFKKVNKLPDDLVLLDLIINDPGNKYFDILSTDKKETANDVVRTSFQDLIQSWLIIPLKWEDYNTIIIMHSTTHIPAFNKKIQSSGHANAINAMSDNWGPSLRFIVEMSKKPQAYGVYAGGQSGNPASKGYEGFIDDWANGKYYKLNFFADKEEATSKTIYKWTIK